jgi:stringent starvation protein B
LTAPTPERKPFSFVDTYAAPASLLPNTRRGKGMEHGRINHGKHKAAEWYTRNGGSFLIRFDARYPLVQGLPARLNNRHDVVLHFGRNLAQPVHDLVITDRGVSGTLSFGGTQQLVFVPWTAVYVMCEGEGTDSVAWPESAPKEALQPPHPGYAAGKVTKTPDGYKFEPAQDDRVRPEHVKFTPPYGGATDVRVVKVPGRPVLTVIKGGRA